ncbi:MAG: hypothetical protein DHS80DRAFT_25176 [Piptocephalis tieghemiana]|nr:MAG: hypothetical protein DHS80DRAFT_25176 [Piptocephalis tieghemiana]
MHPNSYPQRSSAAGRDFSTPSQRAASSSGAPSYGQQHRSGQPPQQPYPPNHPSLSTTTSSQSYYPSRNARSPYPPPSMDRASSSSHAEGLSSGSSYASGESSPYLSHRNHYSSRHSSRSGGRYGYGPDHHRYIPNQGPPLSARSTAEEGSYKSHPIGHSPSAPISSTSSSSSSSSPSPSSGDRSRKTYHDMHGDMGGAEGMSSARPAGSSSLPSPAPVSSSHSSYHSPLPRPSSGKGPRSGYPSSYEHLGHGAPSSQGRGSGGEWRQSPGHFSSMPPAPPSLPPIDPDVRIIMPSWDQRKDREEEAIQEERRMAEKEELRIHAEYRKAQFSRESTEREVWRWERQLELTNMQLDMLG